MRLVTPTPSNDWGPLPPHAHAPARHRLLRVIERVLLAVAVLCLGYYSYVSAEAYLYQRIENRELDAILRSAPAPAAQAVATSGTAGAPAAARRVRQPPRPGAAIGRIEIPRLGVSSIVRAGSDARTLDLAVGHIPGTALPGEDGNVGLAGHRDTFFRKLRNIRPDDEIRVVTPDGAYTYRVQRTNVVNPSDVWVLDPTGEPTLTLVTCYPFTYVGSAPQRFIVRAALEQPSRATLLQ
jgi:sortase A